MPKNYTTDEILAMKLISYERTRADAKEMARDHRQETGRRCVVFNSNGTRARKSTYDKPWQVREVNT
jgi:hypothetical protein